MNLRPVPIVTLFPIVQVVITQRDEFDIGVREVLIRLEDARASGLVQYMAQVIIPERNIANDVADRDEATNN